MSTGLSESAFVAEVGKSCTVVRQATVDAIKQLLPKEKYRSQTVGLSRSRFAGYAVVADAISQV